MIEYKFLEDYPGYRFGSDGSIWSGWNNHGDLTNNWRRLNGNVGALGYRKITIKHKDRGQITMNFNVLILEAFVGPKSKRYLQCCHIDHNKLNNNIDNLFWGTHQDNIDGNVESNIHPHGESHGRAIINDEIARKAKILLGNGISCIKVSKLLHIPKHIVWRIKSGKSWGHVNIDD